MKFLTRSISGYRCRRRLRHGGLVVMTRCGGGSVRRRKLAGGVVRHHAEVGVRPAEVIVGGDGGGPHGGGVRVGAVEDHTQVWLVGEGGRKTERGEGS